VTGKREFRISVGGRLLDKPANIIVGSVYFDSVHASAKVLAGKLAGVRTLEEFNDQLGRINGFYAIVSARKSGVYAAVDRVRSIPLFYATTDTEFLLSDNPEWIIDQLGGAALDRFSAGEFLLTGYVTGPRTLTQSIFQLQAGESLWFSNELADHPTQVKRYFRFLRTPGLGDERDLARQLDDAVQNAIQRLVDLADGRMIAIPLSGGLDSRLIALALKRSGYNAVTTFSYGKPGNEESMISQKVAKAVGFPWTFVSYSEAEWLNWYRSADMSRYIAFAERISSEALIQDWPSIKKLMQLGTINSDTVVVPGHTGDFISGAHIPDELTFFPRLASTNVWRIVRRHHYHLTTVRRAAREVGLKFDDLASELQGRFVSGTGVQEARTQNSVLGVCDCWEWQERQAKFIVNSVRAYDFFGLSWWLPWWDNEVLAFWANVPLELLKGRRLYRGYVKSLEASLKIEVPEPQVPSNRFGKAVNGLAAFLLPAGFDLVREGYKRLTSRLGSLSRSYYSNPLAVNGIVEMGGYRKLLRDGGSINTILAATQIKRWLESDRGGTVPRVR